MKKKLTTTIEIPLCYLCHKPVNTNTMCYRDKKTGAMAHIECFIETMEEDSEEPRCNHIVGLGHNNRGAKLITIKDIDLITTKRKKSLKLKQEFKYCPMCGEKIP